MPLIQTPAPVNRLRTRYKVRGPYGLFLAEEIVPVALVDDVSGQSLGDPNDYPRDASGFIDIPAGGVGTNAEAAAVGFAGRGLVYQVTAAWIMPGTTGRIQFRLGTGVTGIGSLTEDAEKRFWDARLPGPPDLFVGQKTPLTAAVDGTLCAEWRVSNEEPRLIPLNVVLGNGDFIVMVNATTNDGFECTYFWTEHLLEDR